MKSIVYNHVVVHFYVNSSRPKKRTDPLRKEPKSRGATTTPPHTVQQERERPISEDPDGWYMA